MKIVLIAVVVSLHCASNKPDVKRHPPIMLSGRTIAIANSAFAGIVNGLEKQRSGANDLGLRYIDCSEVIGSYDVEVHEGSVESTVVFVPNDRCSKMLHADFSGGGGTVTVRSSDLSLLRTIMSE